MSYAILITGKTSQADTLQQLLLASHNGKQYALTRITNGGRGESNAWTNALDYETIISNADTYTDLIVGEVLSTPLTEADQSALANNSYPVVLIQKLTKQYRLRHQSVSNKTVGDLLKEVDTLIQQDPNLLSAYRSDGRSDKSATKAQTTVAPAPVIKVVREPLQAIEHNFDENSLSFVPSASNPEISGYVERTFASGETETELYDYAMKNGHNILIAGDAGTGKTTSGMVYASKRGLRYYSVNFNVGIDTGQLFGKVIPSEQGNLVWQDGGFTECWRNGNAVINLDELSCMPSKFSSAIHPTLDSRRQLILLDHKGEVIEAGENVLLIGSYNPASRGYRGTQEFNQAFADRFQHKWTFEYDIEIEKQFIKSPTLLRLAQQMREEAIAGVYETPISTRLLKNFEKFARDISYNYAVDNFLNNFRDDEKASVKLLLEAHRSHLESEVVA
jgi:MoxR-like ATPase